MTGRTRQKGSRPPSRRTADVTSPTRRVTRQQNANVNIDPTLGEETAMPPPQARRSARQGIHATVPGADGQNGDPSDQDQHVEPNTPTAAHLRLVSVEDPSTPSQRVARVKLMKKFLARLLSSSDDMFTHFLTKQDESWQEELQGLEDAASVYRKYYVRDSGVPFIELDLVLERMGAQPNSVLWLTVSRIIAAVNLTALLGDLVTLQDANRQSEALSYLQSWDAAFPALFLPEKDLLSPDDTFENSILIRTQLLIFALKDSFAQGVLGEEPALELSRIFCGGESVEELQVALLDEDGAIELRPIPGFDLVSAGAARDRYLTRVKALYNGLDDIPGLETHFGFEEFLRNLQAHVETAYRHLRAVIQSQPSGFALPPFFATTGESESGAQSQIASQLESDALARPVGRPAHIYDPAFHAGAPPSAQPLGGDDNVASSSSYPPPENPYAPQTHGAMYAAAAAAVAAGQKRPAPADDEDDMSFEIDTRAPKNKRKAATRAKRARNKEPQSDGLGGPSSVGAPIAPVAQMEAYPDSSMGMMEPDIEALREASMQVRAAHRKPKEPQTRTAWSQADTRLLIRAVHAFGCKWSQIAKQIETGRLPFEHPRNQQALRDKARILKQDYLRTDSLLPPSFDLVVLGKKEVDNVQSVGRNPFRKESDVLGDVPVNTMLQPSLPQIEAPAQQEEPVELLQQQGEPAEQDAVQPNLEAESAQLEYIPAEPAPSEVVEG